MKLAIPQLSYRKPAYVAGALIVAMVLLYAYFVIGTIVEIVLRQELELSIKEKNSTVASLEAAYLKAQEGVTLEYAAELGFKPIAKEEYLTKQAFSRLTPSINR